MRARFHPSEESGLYRLEDTTSGEFFWLPGKTMVAITYGGAEPLLFMIGATPADLVNAALHHKCVTVTTGPIRLFCRPLKRGERLWCLRGERLWHRCEPRQAHG